MTRPPEIRFGPRVLFRRTLPALTFLPIPGKFIVFFNVLTGIIGLAIVGGSSYVWATYNKNGFDALLAMSTVYIGVAAGVGPFLFSFMGCYGAYANKKSLLFFYLFLLFVILALEIAVAVLFGIYSGQISENSKLSSNSAVESANTVFAVTVNNGVVSTYTYCCSGCGTPPCAPVAVSNDFTVGNCNNTVSFPNNCEVAETCADAPSAPACYQSTDNVAPTVVPTLEVAPAVCLALTNVKFTPTNNTMSLVESPLVGPFTTATSASCGRGSVAQFRTDMYDVAAQYGQTMIIVFSVLAAVQALVLGCGTYIVCCGKKDLNE